MVSFIAIMEAENWFGGNFEMVLESYSEVKKLKIKGYLEFETSKKSKVSVLCYVWTYIVVSMVMWFVVAGIMSR